MTGAKAITILGVFVADTTYRANRQPVTGETILGNSFALGPGGKGSNQAVAAALLGGDVTFITRLGNDAFADLAQTTWENAGVKYIAPRDGNSYTGAAFVFVEETTGNNAIIISPGAAADLSIADIDRNAELIRNSAVFMTQLEQPIPLAMYALELAKGAGVTTILNPAPAAHLPAEIFKFCDFVTPNEAEAGELTGIEILSVEDARKAGDVLLSKGVGNVIITLGEKGVLFHSKQYSEHVPAFHFGEVVETTGAGDAFNAGFAVGLANQLEPLVAVRLGSATAGISVTRPGAAPSMPTMVEVQKLLEN